jgi:hypothetical protein
MHYDPKDTEAYRHNTNKEQPLYQNMRTRICVGCKKLRSVAQFTTETSKICNQCKRRIK